MSEKLNWDSILRDIQTEYDRKENLKTKIAKYVAVTILISVAVANAYYIWVPMFLKK